MFKKYMVKFSITEKYETDIDNVFLELTKKKFLNYLIKHDESLLKCYIQREIDDEDIYKNITVSIIKSDLPSFLSLFVSDDTYEVLTYSKYDLVNKKAKFKVKGKSLDLIQAKIFYDEHYEETDYGCKKIINFEVISDLPIIKNKIEKTLKNNFIESSKIRYGIFEKWINKKYKKKKEKRQDKNSSL